MQEIKQIKQKIDKTDGATLFIITSLLKSYFNFPPFTLVLSDKEH